MSTRNKALTLATSGEPLKSSHQAIFKQYKTMYISRFLSLHGPITQQTYDFEKEITRFITHQVKFSFTIPTGLK